MIAIRADADEKIGLGHLMRCTSIALQLQELGEEPLFLTTGTFSKEFLESRGIKQVCLLKKQENREEELAELEQYLKKYSVSCLLLDTYEVTKYYMETIRTQVQLVYLDDLCAFPYPADIVINSANGIKRRDYGEEYKDTRFFLGSSYLPLRKEFMEGTIEIKPEVKNIFLTSGGTDPYHMILAILKEAESLQSIEFKVVVGKFYPDIDALKQLAENNQKIHIYQNISNVREIMCQCDLAISAGGTTIAELCACGIPTIGFSMVDNQLSGMRDYENAHMIENVGDVRDGMEEAVERIMELLRNLKSDVEKRKKLSQTAAREVDGRGARRIAETLVSLNNE